MRPELGPWRISVRGLHQSCSFDDRSWSVGWHELAHRGGPQTETFVRQPVGCVLRCGLFMTLSRRSLPRFPRTLTRSGIATLMVGIVAMTSACSSVPPAGESDAAADAAAEKDAASEASVVVCPPRSVRACNGVEGAPMTQCTCIVPCGANSENCSANECCAPVLDSYSSGQCISASAPACRRSDGGIDAADASGD